MYKTIYTEKRSYTKYDNEHYLCYLNEEPIEDYVPETAEGEDAPEPVPGFAYTGELKDGGTLIEARDATYDEFVSGLIRTRYPASRVEAIQSNRMIALIEPEHERAAEFIGEWEEFQTYREQCKKQAKTLLNV